MIDLPLGISELLITPRELVQAEQLLNHDDIKSSRISTD
jgi:hypothetical protein